MLKLDSFFLSHEYDEDLLRKLDNYMRKHSASENPFESVRDALQHAKPKLYAKFAALDVDDEDVENGFDAYLSLQKRLQKARLAVITYLTADGHVIGPGEVRAFDRESYSLIYDSRHNLYSVDLVFSTFFDSCEKLDPSLIVDLESRFPPELKAKFPSVFRRNGSSSSSSRDLEYCVTDPASQRKPRSSLSPAKKAKKREKFEAALKGYKAPKKGLRKRKHVLEALAPYKILDGAETRASIAKRIDDTNPELASAIAISGITVLGLDKFWEED